MTAKRDFTLLLAGAGHAHLHLVQRASRLRAAGIRPVLVAPPIFRYSGLATGVLSGAIPAGENVLDVARLAVACGMEHVPTTVTSLDPERQIACLADGQEVSFDAISLNLGSFVPDAPGIPDQPGVWKAKPLSGLADLRAHIESLSHAGLPCPRIIVAGGGQSGFELAAVLAGLCARRFARQEVTLVSPDLSMTWAPAGAAQVLRASFRNRGIMLKEGRVARLDSGVCTLGSGESLACDTLVLATGLEASTPSSEPGLPCDDRGRVRVTTRLNVAGYPRIFAVGDCATVEGHARPQLGVFGVRAAPILLRNICALAQGDPLAEFVPQERWLSILDLGDETGLAIRGGLWTQGRGALLLKRWLDRRFLSGIRRAC